MVTKYFDFYAFPQEHCREVVFLHRGKVTSQEFLTSLLVKICCLIVQIV